MIAFWTKLFPALTLENEPALKKRKFSCACTQTTMCFCGQPEKKSELYHLANYTGSSCGPTKVKAMGSYKKSETKCIISPILLAPPCIYTALHIANNFIHCPGKVCM